MRQPTFDANIAPASNKDYGEVMALLEAASLPTEDLEQNSMAHFLIARDGSGKVIGAIGVERYGREALLRSLVVATEYRNRRVVRNCWRSSKPAAALWRWRTYSC